MVIIIATLSLLNALTFGSKSVSVAIKTTGGQEAEGTSKFAEMMDKTFDCLNVHNYTHGVHCCKDFQKPYTSSDDTRLKVVKYISI